MTRLDDLAHAAVRSPLTPPPTMDALRARVRRRTRRLIASAVTCVVVLGAAVIGLVAASASSDSSSRSIIATPGPSTAPPRLATPRPVLDGCAAISASDNAAEELSPVGRRSAPIRAEVFADPTRGVSGPLAVVVRNPGSVQHTGDGNAGGKMANTQVNGRDAYITPDLNTHTELVLWDLSSGGTASVSTKGLTDDETRAVAEQIDAGSASLPENLQSIGMTGTATASMSTCVAQASSVRIIEIRGTRPSRYALAMISGTDEARRFDNDDATIVIERFGGNFDVANATYHEASPREWQALVR
jgi:hypothetical protein